MMSVEMCVDAHVLFGGVIQIVRAECSALGDCMPRSQHCYAAVISSVDFKFHEIILDEKYSYELKCHKFVMSSDFWTGCS